MRSYSDEEFFDSPFRGVTSVLNAIFGNKFENSSIPDYVLKAAGERGTAVHKYIENWLKWYKSQSLILSSEDEPHLGLEYSVYETNFKDWLENRIEFDIEPMYEELRVINKKLGVKGIIDCVAKVNGKVCLIDWKTSSNLDEWSTNCQLQLYYMMLLHGKKSEKEIAKQVTELRCLSITKHGYRWFKFDIDKKLGQAILKLWNEHFREISELEKLKERKSISKPVVL